MLTIHVLINNQCVPPLWGNNNINVSVFSPSRDGLVHTPLLVTLIGCESTRNINISHFLSLIDIFK